MPDRNLSRQTISGMVPLAAQLGWPREFSLLCADRLGS